MTARRTTEEFKKLAIERHGNRYDYSEVEYVNRVTPVFIICKEHGKFEQAPYSHLVSKNGCDICSTQNRYKYECNRKFFKEENDSPESFYIAAFIAGDGSLSSNIPSNYTIHLTLKDEDKNHLEKILKIMKSNHPIVNRKRFDERTNKEYIINYFEISCKEMYYDLARFNIMSRKSLTYDIPDWILNHKYRKDFIRGIFDADGCICFPALRKDRKEKTVQAHIHIRGTKEELSKIHKILYNEGILQTPPEDKIISFDSGIWSLQYTGNPQVYKILDWIYKDATLYLDRKYMMYKQLQKFIENYIPDYPKGSKCYNALFKDNDVKLIREDFAKLTKGKLKFIDEMASKYGSSTCAIQDIVYGKSWKHLL